MAWGGKGKRRFAKFTTNRVVNPLVRAGHKLGLTGGTALLETTGRKTQQPRQTPVGNGLRGNEFWIITEHGRHSGYVKNIEANPRVRVCVRGCVFIRAQNSSGVPAASETCRVRP